MEQFPICLQWLLQETGYNTIASLSCIDEKKICEIEEYLTGNKQIVNALECCFSDEYRSLDEFHFIPGHKAIILSLRDDIKEMRELNVAKKRAKKQMIPDDVMFEHLLAKFKAVPAKAGFKKAENIISEKNITEFERVDEGEIDYRCRFRCPVCPKTFSLIYKKFWQSSNATKHLKMHILSMNK